MAGAARGSLNGHPAVDGVPVGMLHKTEGGRDVGVDVAVEGVPRACILVHRSSVLAAVGEGRAARHDVLLPDASYDVYQWDGKGPGMRATGRTLDCGDAADAVVAAAARYGRTRGLAVSLSTAARNRDVANVRMAAARDNLVTPAYLAGEESGQQSDEDGLDL